MKLQHYLYLVPLLLILSVNPLSLAAQTTDKAKLLEFEDAITKGEAFLNAKDYAKAKAEYQKALSIDPTAKYPKDKLAQIRKVYTDPKDETDFQNAVSKGDQFVTAGNYQAAKEQYTAALLIKPDNKQVKDKMAAADKASSENDTRLKEYNSLVGEADKLYSEKNYPSALDKYKAASTIMPSETYSLKRIEEIETLLAKEKAIEDKYNAILNEGDEAYMSRDFVLAKRKYEEAVQIKPAETYPKSMLERITESMVKQASDQANIEKENASRYSAAIAAGDKFVNEERYNEALQEYTTASQISPLEAYPKQKIQQINTILAQKEETRQAEIAALKLAEERKQDSVKAAEVALQLAEVRKQDSIKSAQETERLSLLKMEQEQQARIEAENQQAKQQEEARLLELSAQKLAEEQKTDSINKANEEQRIAALEEEERKKAVDDAEQQARQQQEDERVALLNAEKQAEAQKQDSALMAQAAIEKQEQDRLAELKRLEDEQAQQLEFEKLSQTEKEYLEAIETGNTFFTLEDYASATKMFEKAAELKPSEDYPKNRLITIHNIVLERLRNNLESYNKFIAAGDLAFQSNIYDKALEEFEKAGQMRPEERYPSMMIESIKKLMEDNAIISITEEPVVLLDAQEKKYLFNAIDMRLRKNNYLLIKAKKTSEKSPKVFINYGKDSQKSGGFVLRGIESEESTDYLLRISTQDKWYRLENNWISLYPEGGDIEITSIKISQGDIQPLK